MSKSIGSKRQAPCTIFATTNLSPRQIANKAYNLGCKKLDRDDKRSNHKYHLRERVLLYSTISKAEETLSAKSNRLNRRTLSDEEDQNEFTTQQNHHHTLHTHSPLREEQHDDQDIPISPLLPSSSTIDSNQPSSHTLFTDCNLLNKVISVM